MTRVPADGTGVAMEHPKVGSTVPPIVRAAVGMGRLPHVLICKRVAAVVPPLAEVVRTCPLPHDLIRGQGKVIVRIMVKPALPHLREVVRTCPLPHDLICRQGVTAVQVIAQTVLLFLL